MYVQTTLLDIKIKTIIIITLLATLKININRLEIVIIFKKTKVAFVINIVVPNSCNSNIYIFNTKIAKYLLYFGSY